MREATFTLLTTVCGIAGAVVIACTPVPGQAAEPPHPCETLRPALIELHQHRRNGVHPAIIGHFIETEPRYNDAARSMLHLLVLGTYKHHPASFMLSTTKFADLTVDLCKQVIEQPVRIIEQRPTLRHGSI